MRRVRVLQVLLVLIGSFFVAGIYPLLTSLPQHPQSDYGDHMMLAVYFVLGVFLLLAVRRPAAPPARSVSVCLRPGRNELHWRQCESATLRQSATAKSAGRVLLVSVPIAMPNIEDQTFQSSLPRQLTVIIPHLAN